MNISWQFVARSIAVGMEPLGTERIALRISLRGDLNEGIPKGIREFAAKATVAAMGRTSIGLWATAYLAFACATNSNKRFNKPSKTLPMQQKHNAQSVTIYAKIPFQS